LFSTTDLIAGAIFNAKWSSAFLWFNLKTFRQLEAVRFAPEVFGIKRVSQMSTAKTRNEADVSSVVTFLLDYEADVSSVVTFRLDYEADVSIVSTLHQSE